MSDLTKQSEKLIQAYRLINAELSAVENPNKIFHRYHAAYIFFKNLQMSLKTMQHSSTELETAVKTLKYVFLFIFPFKPITL